jgi:hypothetical protein
MPGRLLGRAGPTTVVQKQGESVPGRVPAKSGPSTVEQDSGIPLDRFNLDRLCAQALTKTVNISAMNKSSSLQERAENPIQECKSAESEFANQKQLMQRLKEEVGGSYPMEIRLDRLFQLVDLQKDSQVTEVQPYKKLRNLLGLVISNYCNLIWICYYFRRKIQETQLRDPSVQSKIMITFGHAAPAVQLFPWSVCTLIPTVLDLKSY